MCEWIPVIDPDGSATMATDLSLAIAGSGFVLQRVGLLEGIECQCWREVFLDDFDPGLSRRADSLSLSNNAGEPGFWLKQCLG